LSSDKNIYYFFYLINPSTHHVISSLLILALEMLFTFDLDFI